MTKEKISSIRNATFDSMMIAHEMKERTTAPYWKNFAESLYEAHWATYQLLCDKDFLALLAKEGNNAEKEEK